MFAFRGSARTVQWLCSSSQVAASFGLCFPTAAATNGPLPNCWCIHHERKTQQSKMAMHHPKALKIVRVMFTCFFIGYDSTISWLLILKLNMKMWVILQQTNFLTPFSTALRGGWTQHKQLELPLFLSEYLPFSKVHYIDFKIRPPNNASFVQVFMNQNLFCRFTLFVFLIIWLPKHKLSIWVLNDWK